METKDWIAKTSDVPEALSSLYNAELVFLDGPLDGREDVETATAGWVQWFNTERLHSMLGYRTPAEVEAEYFGSLVSTNAA